MKASLYFSHASRSLWRGGQRTILAIFCVVVGVMAVVSLQLVGQMLQHSLSANVRETNGGDIALTSPGVPLKASDLAFFDQLKHAGTITNYTAIINATGGLTSTTTSTQSFNVEAVDPSNYPLVSPPTFVEPKDGSVSQLLTNDQVIVTQNFLDRYHKQLSDTFNVYIQTNMGLGQTLSVKIAGIAANSGLLAQSGNLVLISTQDYLATAPTALANYSTVDITATSQIPAVARAVTTQFPLASTQTTADVLKGQQSSIDVVNTFLQVASLLALLIGGVGIVNTISVSLSRRKTEIAMLKTAGYRRGDLYLLFGLEAGLLGLVGGIVGAITAIGVSYLVRGLMENFGFNIFFELDFRILLGGVGIGFATALIFGLLPIAQAANVRPLQVIREFESRSKGGKALTVLLLLLLSVLFCLLATLILNKNLIMGIEVTYGTFISLLVLSLFFNLIIAVVGKLPVPERLRIKQCILILVGLVFSALVYKAVPVFGAFLLATVLLGVVIILLPRSWKVSTKMALRNLGRRRARTVSTMLALFIGVFGLGVIIGLGHDVQSQTTDMLNQNAPYNLVATTSGQDSNTLRTNLSTIPGVSSYREDPYVTSLPKTINGQSVQHVMGNNLQEEIGVLSGIEGYNLTQNVPTVSVKKGRNLNASDANTNNVLVSGIMASGGWFTMGIQPGSTITLASPDGKQLRTVTVVGIISIATSYENLGKVLAPAPVVNALSSGSTATNVFYMNVPPAQMNQALDTLGKIAPNATVQDLTSSATAFLQTLGNILNMLIAIASLSVLAGVVIIANAVALAMLERKRELGIMKSVGYTSGTVLRQILIENSIIGGLSAFIAMLLASTVVAMGSKQFFQTSFTVEPLVVVCLILGPVLLAMLTATVVSWQSIRVRPLEVLRYE